MNLRDIQERVNEIEYEKSVGDTENVAGLTTGLLKQFTRDLASGHIDEIKQAKAGAKIIVEIL